MVILCLIIATLGNDTFRCDIIKNIEPLYLDPINSKQLNVFYLPSLDNAPKIAKPISKCELLKNV